MSTEIPAITVRGDTEKTYQQMLDYGLKPSQVVDYAVTCLQCYLKQDPYIHKAIRETVRSNRHDLQLRQES